MVFVPHKTSARQTDTMVSGAGSVFWRHLSMRLMLVYVWDWRSNIEEGGLLTYPLYIRVTVRTHVGADIATQWHFRARELEDPVVGGRYGEDLGFWELSRAEDLGIGFCFSSMKVRGGVAFFTNFGHLSLTGDCRILKRTRGQEKGGVRGIMGSHR
jgi:hypothetical protein